MNIYNFLQLERAPKLDLHVHLQGSGNLHVMNYLINKNKLTVRAQILHDKKLNIRLQLYSELMSVLLAEKTTISDITSLFDYRTTDQFFTTYKFLNLFINSISDLDLYIKGVVIKLIKQNIVYSDIIISLPELVDQRMDIQQILMLLNKYTKLKQIKINWWIDLVRHRGAENALNLLKSVIQSDTQNTICGINLGGDEKKETLESFQSVFYLAQENGLKINLHDGETQFVANQKIYQNYGINRIAHGLCYIQKNNLHNFLIEVCLSSNYKTKIINSVYSHPLFKSIGNLNNVVICTDDSTLFETSLAKELSYILAFYGKKKLIEVIKASLFCVNTQTGEAIIKWYYKNIE